MVVVRLPISLELVHTLHPLVLKVFHLESNTFLQCHDLCPCQIAGLHCLLRLFNDRHELYLFLLKLFHLSLFDGIPLQLLAAQILDFTPLALVERRRLVEPHDHLFQLVLERAHLSLFLSHLHRGLVHAAHGSAGLSEAGLVQPQLLIEFDDAPLLDLDLLRVQVALRLERLDLLRDVSARAAHRPGDRSGEVRRAIDPRGVHRLSCEKPPRPPPKYLTVLNISPSSADTP